MKRNFFITVLILAVALSAYSSGQKDSSGAAKPVIRYAYQWTGDFDEQMKVYADAVKDDFILELECTPGLDHKQKIQVEIAAGETPDIYQYWSYETNLRDMAENDIILNVNDYLAVTDKVSRDNFSAGAWSATEVDGQNFGFPVSSFKGFFLANKALFESYGMDLPETWADLEQIAGVFRKDGIIPFSMGSIKGDPGHLFFSSLAFQAADGYADAQSLAGTLNFDTNANHRAADAIADLIEWEVMPSDTITNGGWGPQTALYNSRKAAMIFSFPWKISDFNAEIVEESVLIPVPSIPGAENSSAGFTVGGISISNLINKKSFNDPAKQAAVVTLTDYLLSDKVYTDVALNGKGFPAKILELPEGQDTLFDMVQKFTSEQDIYGIHEFFFPTLITFDGYKSACDELYAGAVTPDEFVEKIQKGLNRLQ